MELPALKDLLPHHIFCNPASASTTRPTPPPTAPLYSDHQRGSSSNSNSAVPVPSSSYSSLQPPHASTSIGAVSSQPWHPYPHRTSAREGQTSPSVNGSAAFDARHFHSRPSEINMESSAALDDRRRDRSLGLYVSAGVDDVDDDGRREQDGAGIGATSNNADENRSRKHICPTCKKSFNRPSSLKIHMNTHTGVKPFACPHPGCGRAFNVSSNMRRHYRNHANRVPPAPLPLPLRPTGEYPLTLPPLINAPPIDPSETALARSAAAYGRTLPYERTWPVRDQTIQQHQQERTHLEAGDHQYLHLLDRHRDSCERETDLPPALADSVTSYSGMIGDDRRESDPRYEHGRESANGSGRVDYGDVVVASRERRYAERPSGEADRDGRPYYDAYPSLRRDYASTSTSTRDSYPETTHGYFNAPLDFHPPVHYPYPYPYPVLHNSAASSVFVACTNSNSRGVEGDPSSAYRRSTRFDGVGVRPVESGAGGAGGTGVLPTPPYTNEAPFSPPAYALPLVQSQPHSLPHPSGYMAGSNLPLPLYSTVTPAATDNDRPGRVYGRGDEGYEHRQGDGDSDLRVNEQWEEHVRRMRERDWTWHDRDERDDASQSENSRELLDPNTGLGARSDMLVRTVSSSCARETPRRTPTSGESEGNGARKVCGAGKPLDHTSNCPLGGSGDARQQPSPDTPSMRVPVLTEEERSVSGPGPSVNVDAIEREQVGSKGEKEKAERARPMHTRRESLQLASIMNPADEPTKPTTNAQCSADGMSPDSVSTPPANGGGRAEPASASVTLEPASVDAPADNTKKPMRMVGKTPGAAPPPPYPLLKRPSEMMLEIDEEEEEERKESLPAPVRARSAEGKGARRTKKRKRR